MLTRVRVFGSAVLPQVCNTTKTRALNGGIRIENDFISLRMTRHPARDPSWNPSESADEPWKTSTRLTRSDSIIWTSSSAVAIGNVMVAMALVMKWSESIYKVVPGEHTHETMSHSQEIEFGSKDSPERSNAFKYVFDVGSRRVVRLYPVLTRSVSSRLMGTHGARDSRG